MKIKKHCFNLALIISIVVGVNCTSCKPDSFTEKDAMLLQSQLDKEKVLLADSLSKENVRVTYILSLVDAYKTTLLKSAKSETGITGASVTMGQEGKLSTKTTDASGLVVFDNMQPGLATLHITLTGYSEVNAVIDFSKAGVGIVANGGIQVGNVIPMITISGASVGSIKGKITFESDLTNKTPEAVPTGIKVIATVDPSSPALASIAGDIIKKISYDNLSLEGTTDANGDFTLAVPPTSQGLNYSLSVSDFTANQNLLMTTKNGVPVSGVQTVLTQFGSNFSSGSSTIPGTTLSPTITIGLPDYVYTQASATAVVTAGRVTSINIVSGGSNYITEKVDVTIGNPASGTTATAFAVVTNGIITAVNIISQGSNYTTVPTVTISSNVGKIQARAVPGMFSDGSIQSITVTSSGDGYLAVPSVTINSALSGYGSGAYAVAVVANGLVTSINLLNGGSGYIVKNIPTSVINAPSSIPVDSKGTGTSIVDIYLGTGHRTIEY